MNLPGVYTFSHNCKTAKLSMFAPSNKQNLISSGNETLDNFLGGGLLPATLNLFERQGPSSRALDLIINKSIAATTLAAKRVLLYVNFNTSLHIDKADLLASLPAQRKVKSELLYKDIRGRSELSKIKIAWRYTNQGVSSPTDGIAKVEQVDFGVALINTIEKEDLGSLDVINVVENEPVEKVITTIRETISDYKKNQQEVTIIIKDLLHPFSPIIHSEILFIRWLYAFRCIARTLARGAIVVSYDRDSCVNYLSIHQQLYNVADSVVSLYSYETGENLQTGYKDIDGTLALIKVPKVNSFGFHFQQSLSDWGFRLTKNNRFFVVEELSLPPCDDDENKTQPADIKPDQTKIMKTNFASEKSIDRLAY